MDEHKHHEELIASLSKEYEDILKNSDQGIYIYLDDIHKLCNKKFASLLGYESESEWAQVEESFTDAFVDPESQEDLVSSYQNAIENKVGSTNKIIWKKKDGSTVNTNVILVPIAHQKHLFALHFVSV